MALNNKNIAYDFSLFEEPSRQIKKENNVVHLPRNNKSVKRRAKSKYKTVFSMLSYIIIGTTVVGSMLYGQVQLNEVTSGINMATKQLNESESVYTQLQVKVESKLSLGAVEEYARNNLQMEKINPYQIEYITLSKEDKGEIYQSRSNMFDKINSYLHKE